MSEQTPSAEKAWPCDNYRAPLTCLTAAPSEASRCDWCAAVADSVAQGREEGRDVRPGFDFRGRPIPPRGGVSPTERSAFWEDHERDMQDPEYRAAFEQATRDIPPE